MTGPDTLSAARLFSLTGRRAIVTGAGSGLGRAIACALSANGSMVTITDISQKGLETTSAMMPVAPDRTMTLDISDPAAVDRAMDDTQPQIVIANAGTTAGPGFDDPAGTIEAADMKLWRHSMTVNLDGAFHTMRSAARVMRPEGVGSIIVTASIAGLKVSPLPAYAYHAAKAGVVQLVRLASKELGPQGIRVNAIAPGPFATGMAGGRLADPARNARFIETVPLGRVAQPEEIAGLALLLASDAGSYINGAVIPIDGGDSA